MRSFGCGCFTWRYLLPYSDVRRPGFVDSQVGDEGCFTVLDATEEYALAIKADS